MNNATNSFLNVVHVVLAYPLFTLGERSFTVALVFKLLLLFTLVLGAEHVLRRFFTKRLLIRTKLDAPLQYAIARISGYLFILLGFYVALTAVGLNLSSLAVVAGAVGIGIGFGLQNIIHNFVSGIIILAERPIALGDRIEVAGVAGRVSRIRLRSTEIITNDNISIIVPNSDFITHPVTNWSHGDSRVQIRLPVGIAYGTDVKKLKSVLLEVAAENVNVLKSPEPTVYFDGFGDSALLFELGVWTSAMTHSPRRAAFAANSTSPSNANCARARSRFPSRNATCTSSRARLWCKTIRRVRTLRIEFSFRQPALFLELVDLLAQAGHEQHVVQPHREAGCRFEGFQSFVWAGPGEEHHVYAIALAQCGFGQRLAVQRRAEADLSKLVVSAQLLSVAARVVTQALGQSIGHVTRGQHHEVCAELFQHGGVLGIDRAADEPLHPEFLEQQCREDAALHVLADAHDHGVGLLHARFLERVLVFGIHLDGVKTVMHQVLHAVGVPVGQDNVDAELGQPRGKVRAKPACANDEDSLCHKVFL